MKTVKYFCTFLCALLVFAGCEKESNDKNQTGVLKFRFINPIQESFKNYSITKSEANNPNLTGDITPTFITSILFTVGDVWVSKGEVKSGEPDTLKWVRITKTTNTQPKLFEEYIFDDVNIPAGEYKSIKITLKNIAYRYVRLVSNPAVTYQLLETMGPWEAPCDENDTSWAPTNYFGRDGNHYLLGSTFSLVSSEEKLSGFKIEPGKTAVLSWRFGAGASGMCISNIIDVNKNRKWDCGTDRIDDVCPDDVEFMWDFVVEYI